MTNEQTALMLTLLQDVLTAARDNAQAALSSAIHDVGEHILEIEPQAERSTYRVHTGTDSWSLFAPVCTNEDHYESTQGDLIVLGSLWEAASLTEIDTVITLLENQIEALHAPVVVP